MRKGINKQKKDPYNLYYLNKRECITQINMYNPKLKYSYKYLREIMTDLTFNTKLKPMIKQKDSWK